MAVGFISGSLFLGAFQAPAPSLASVSAPVAVESNTPRPQIETQGFAEIVKAVKPAVVNITAKTTVTSKLEPFSGPGPAPFGPDFWGRRFFDMPERQHEPGPPFGGGMGSGVIVSPDGYILTNNHVVEGAEEVTVTIPDKREFRGKIIGSDPKTDLSVLKIEGKDLPYIAWGDSSKLEVGDFVLAIGNPFGLNSTVTQGIVSALGRGGMGITQYENFIQTDAAINPGNSGGALVNMRGELVGINTAIVSRTGGYQGVGFAIPTSMGKPVFESLVKTGRVIRGYVGVGIQDVTPDLAKALGLPRAEGALVTDVKAGGPASKAGIARGDTIIKYQDEPVADPRALQQAVTQTPVGKEVTLTVIRNGQPIRVTTKIEEHPDSIQVAQAPTSSEDTALAGLAVEDITPQIARQLGLGDDVKGVVVRDVQVGSHADRAGLARGDVISEINRRPVHSVRDYDHVITGLHKEEPALFLIYRRGVPLFVSVRV